MKYLSIALMFLCPIAMMAEGEKEFKQNYVPKDGYVPNRETALVIAEAVLKAAYGKEQIDREKPFQVTLSNDIWIITGSLPKRHVGGVAKIEISKMDGKIIRMIHGK